MVENQFRNNDPPETSQTLERLLGKGYSRMQATEMIGAAALTEEIWTIMLDHTPYDQERYTTSLEHLG